MKNSILFCCLAVISIGLMAFSFADDQKTICSVNETPICNTISEYDKMINDIMEVNYSDFFYDVGTRFAPISKSEISEARSMEYFLEDDYQGTIVEYKSVSVIIIMDDKQTEKRATGNSEILTEAQLELLQSMDYSTNFTVRADFVEKDEITGELKNYIASPHHTIVPERQATYELGNDALLEYLKAGNKENTANLDESKLQPAKLYFTITKDGLISNLRLDRSSGYSKIDIDMIDLLSKAPGKWMPAQNSQGENIDQELVVSFGMVGC